MRPCHFLDRLRFLAITTSNLDEFFMVRVGSLRTAIRARRPGTDPGGLSPAEQLAAASERVDSMMAGMYACFLNELEPELAECGSRRRYAMELNDDQLRYVEQVFDEQIQAILTPVAIHDPVRFPLLQGRTVNVAVQLVPEAASIEYRYAVIPFGRFDQRFITLPSEGGFEFVLAEDVIALLIQRFFPGEDIVATVPFRITRYADLTVREDDGADLLAEMEDVLDERKDSFCVRLEVSDSITTSLQSFLMSLLMYDGSGCLRGAGTHRLE